MAVSGSGGAAMAVALSAERWSELSADAAVAFAAASKKQKKSGEDDDEDDDEDDEENDDEDDDEDVDLEEDDDPLFFDKGVGARGDPLAVAAATTAASGKELEEGDVTSKNSSPQG